MFVVHWAELLDHEADCEVLVAVEDLGRIYKVQLQAPLRHMKGLVSELRELEVAEIATEVVDALLREDGLHEGVTITHQDVRQYLNHDHCHVSPQCHGHLEVAAIDQFLLVNRRKTGQNFLSISAICVKCLRLLTIRLRRILKRMRARTRHRWPLRLDHIDLSLHITPPV